MKPAPFIVVSAASAASLLAACTQPAAPVVEARAAWCRASAGGAQTGACYLTLAASRDDRLLAAGTDAAQRVEIHNTAMQGTIARMREMKSGLPLAAGEAVTLAPGGAHLMLVGLAAPLTEGGDVALTLRFEHAPPVTLSAPVRRGAPEPADAHPGH